MKKIMHSSVLAIAGLLAVGSIYAYAEADRCYRAHTNADGSVTITQIQCPPSTN